MRLYSLFTCWGRWEVSCVFRARDLCSAAPTDQKWFTARRIHIYVLYNGAFAHRSPAQSYLIKWDAHSASANLSRFCSFSEFHSPLRLTTRLAKEEEEDGKKKKNNPGAMKTLYFSSFQCIKHAGQFLISIVSQSDYTALGPAMQIIRKLSRSQSPHYIKLTTMNWLLSFAKKQSLTPPPPLSTPPHFATLNQAQSQ